ncbi:MAG: GHMP kinase [Chloroflexi bacterium]|nr:GHMP kinase [Chloroflexota bacterium]
MRVSATVPTRIDLAGGTLDIYPLYLFEDGGLTLNAAIDVCGHVTVQTRPDRRIVIRSDDRHAAEEIADLESMALGGDLDLVKRALRHYRPAQGLDISLRSEVPQGSGLGASSALLMALSSALNEVQGLGLSRERIIDLGANIEAQVISIPTGKQDYFPPLYGGVCCIWFDVGGFRLESLSAGNHLAELLNQRLILSHTNISRFSGITNWAMLRRYIEREGDTVARIHHIKEVALAMRECLRRLDVDGLAELLAREWDNRKGLAAGVTTPEVEAMVAAAQREGALASKLCGAGGGGGMITYAPPERVPAVKQALGRAGATVMDFRIVDQGLRMAVEP